MATTLCPRCGYAESDGRRHDRSVYREVCSRCAPRDDHSASRRVDVLEREAPHLIAPPAPLEAADHDA